MKDDTAMKTAIKILIENSWALSSILRTIFPFKKSRAKVDAEVMTSDESVDIDAAKTSTITTPISGSGNPESMEGIMESKPPALTLAASENSRPNPPRK
jgi:hypothetical protein